jgi:hypothetical protein
MLLLPALPEETLYSRCVRTRDVYGMSAEQFFDVFFKKTIHTVHPYLNTSLNLLSGSTLESGYELWLNQTLIPLYAWALPEHRSALEDLSISAVKLQTICKLSNFVECHPAVLKHCPVCTHHDVKRFGVAYWHRQHQIFGVTSCNYHHARLNYITHSRLSNLTHHPSQYKKRQISLTKECDFNFARFSSYFLDGICNANVDVKNHQNISSDIILSQHIRTNNERYFFRELYNIASKLDHTEKKLLPTAENYENYWKTLLCNTSPQSPSRYLILLYCINQLCIK